MILRIISRVGAEPELYWPESQEKRLKDSQSYKSQHNNSSKCFFLPRLSIYTGQVSMSWSEDSASLSLTPTQEGTGKKIAKISSAGVDCCCLEKYDSMVHTSDLSEISVSASQHKMTEFVKSSFTGTMQCQGRRDEWRPCHFCLHLTFWKGTFEAHQVVVLLTHFYQTLLNAIL